MKLVPGGARTPVAAIVAAVASERFFVENHRADFQVSKRMVSLQKSCRMGQPDRMSGLELTLVDRTGKCHI